MTNLKPAKRFYGWTLIVLLFVCYSATTISTNSLPLFFPELMKYFGWKHAQVVQPASFYFLYIAVFSPVIGFYLTKVSPKKIMLGGMILGFLSVLLFSVVDSYLQFHLVYIALSLSITMCGLLPSMVIINNWFQKKRGLATGVFLLGSSFGGILFPQIASRLIPEYGWRGAAVGIAVLGAIVSFIPIFFIKNKPEELGLLIDNGELIIDNEKWTRPPARSDNEKKMVQSLAQPIVHYPLSIIHLFKSPVFYLLLLITAAFWFCGFGVLQNLRLYLQDYGFSLQRAANISSLFSLFSMTGKVTFGYLSDRFSKMNILLLATVFLIAGVASLRLVPVDESFAYLFTAFYGFGYSGAFAMIQLTVAELYRGPSFSKVLGMVNSFDSVGGFAGVALLGYLRTQNGNYDTAMTMLLVVCSVAFVLALALRKMVKSQPINA